MLLFNIDKDEGTQAFSLDTASRQNSTQDYHYGGDQRRQVQHMDMEIQNVNNVDNQSDPLQQKAQQNQKNMVEEIDEGKHKYYSEILYFIQKHYPTTTYSNLLIIDKLRQEKFYQKEKEFREAQLKEKKMCLKVHFKNKQIMEIKKLIEQNTLTLQYYEQKKYLQPTDVNYSRSLLEEYCSLRDKINKSNETLRQLDIKRWDSYTFVQNLKDLQKQEESLSQYKISEYTKEQKQQELKRIEEYKDQIKKINEEIEKLKEKHIQNSDNYSTIKLQLKEQNIKNEQLKQEIENLRRNN